MNYEDNFVRPYIIDYMLRVQFFFSLYSVCPSINLTKQGDSFRSLNALIPLTELTLSRILLSRNLQIYLLVLRRASLQPVIRYSFLIIDIGAWNFQQKF